MPKRKRNLHGFSFSINLMAVRTSFKKGHKCCKQPDLWDPAAVVSGFLLETELM